MGSCVVGTEKSSEGSLGRLILNHVDSSDVMVKFIEDTKDVFKERQQNPSVGDNGYAFKLLLSGHFHNVMEGAMHPQHKRLKWFSTWQGFRRTSGVGGKFFHQMAEQLGGFRSLDPAQEPYAFCSYRVSTTTTGGYGGQFLCHESRGFMDTS